MKLIIPARPSLLLASLTLVLAVAACGKPSDVPALREEADSLVSHTGPRVGALKFRLGMVKSVFDSSEKKYSTAPDYALAQRAVTDGSNQVRALENELASAKVEIEDKAKDETGALLVEFIHEKRELWDAQLVHATADAETGEVWLARMQADAMVASIAAAQAAAAKTDTPPPADQPPPL